MTDDAERIREWFLGTGPDSLLAHMLRSQAMTDEAIIKELAAVARASDPPREIRSGTRDVVRFANTVTRTGLTEEQIVWAEGEYWKAYEERIAAMEDGEDLGFDVGALLREAKKR